MHVEEYSNYLETLRFKNRRFIARVQDARATASSSKQKKLDKYVKSMEAALAASDKLEMLGIEHRWRVDQLKDESAIVAKLKKNNHNEYVKSMDAALAASDYMEMSKLEQQWRIDRVQRESAIVNLNAKIKQLCAYDYAQIYDYDFFRDYLLNNDESSETSSAHDLEYEMEWWDRYLDVNYFDDSDDSTSTHTPNEDEAIGYFPDNEDDDEDDICGTRHRKVSTDTNTDMRRHTKRKRSFMSGGHHGTTATTTVTTTATTTTTASKQRLEVSDGYMKDLIDSIGDDAYVYTSINPNPIDCRNHRFKRARDFVYRVSKRLRNR